MDALPCVALAVAVTVYRLRVMDIGMNVAPKTFILVFCSAYIALKVYRMFTYPYYFSPLRHLPGPKDHHFLIGQALNQFNSGSPIQPYVTWMRRWPDAPMIRYFEFGNREAVLVNSLSVFREALTTHAYSFVKPDFFIKAVRPVTGRGLLFAEGEEHENLREIFKRPFSIGKLKNLIPVFQTEAAQLSEYFDKQIEPNSGIVEVVSTFSSATLDIIAVAALGVRFKNLETVTTMHECFTRLFDPPPIGQILLALDAFVPIRWLPLAENRRFKEANAETRRVLREIIHRRVKHMTEGAADVEASVSKDRRDLLTYIIEETLERGQLWTEEDILGHMLNFVAAGHETTATALAWATHVFTLYPDIQDRLRAEVLVLLKQTPTPDYSDIENLKYLHNFTYEILRRYCPAIYAPRTAAREVIINGVRIPKGTTLMVMLAMINLSAAIWGEDVDDFNPDRWDRADISPNSLASFLQGPRVCIGRLFGMLEFKTLVIEMISKFRFEAVVKGEIVLVNPGPLLRPKGGLEVKVSRL